MPTIYRERSYRFFISPRDRGEPPHVHVRSGDADAKVWLVPWVHFAKQHRYNRQQLAHILDIVERKRYEFLVAWHAFFAT